MGGLPPAKGCYHMEYTIINHAHIFEAGKFFPQCHASTVEVLPDATVVAAWFAGAHEKAPDVSIWFSRQIEGRWDTPRCIAAARSGEPCWNPVLFFYENKLRLYLKRGHEIPQWRTCVMESADGGLTWSGEKELVLGDAGGRGPVKNKCIKLSDGRILAPASVETAENWVCFADLSQDGGETWEKSGEIPFDRASFLGCGMIQPTVWEDGKGICHALMRSTEGAVYASCSADGGVTWSRARRTALPNNNCGIDVARLADGRLVLVYNPVSGNWAARTPIAFSVSEDNGMIWSEPNILDDAPCVRNEERAEFSYPAIVARGNEVHITYTWKRKTIAYWKIALAEKTASPCDIADGVWVTMITPFTQENCVDYSALENLIEWYIQKGVQGLFAVCQSSEMFFLSREERVQIARFVAEKAAGRVQVVASGHVCENIEDQIHGLQEIAATGVKSVVLVTNRLAGEDENDAVWKANVQKILDAVPNCDFGLYECPYPYKRLVSPRLLRWCADTGRFLFLKDTSCDLENMAQKLRAVQGTRLKIFNANAATLLESMRMGVSGYCGVMANYHPELYVWLCENYPYNRQQSESVQAFAALSSLTELRQYPTGAKYHLNLCGVPMALTTRSKKTEAFSMLNRLEIQALHRAYQDFIANAQLAL